MGFYTTICSERAKLFIGTLVIVYLTNNNLRQDLSFSATE